MALGPGGEIFVLYANQQPCAGFSGCSIDWSVERLSPDGIRDGSFGTGPGSVLTVHGNEYEPAALAVGADGKPLVAGLDAGRVVLARFDQQGHVESTLGASDSNPLFGVAYTPPVVAVQGDGKVVVAVGSAEELRIVRYMPGGERDPGFGNAGEATMTLGTRSRPTGLLLGATGSISLAAPSAVAALLLMGRDRLRAVPGQRPTRPGPGGPWADAASDAWSARQCRGGGARA
ncbi:MAG: hypothetical protein ACRDLL_07615 [Solirubrobacterales bacterium]